MRAADRLGDIDCSRVAAVRKQNGELLAAEPSDQIAVRQSVSGPLGEVRENAVTGHMSMRVVDALEVVQVEHQQADRRLCASRVGKFRFRVAEERTAREDPGQMVEFDGKEELTLGSTAFLGRTGNRDRPHAISVTAMDVMTSSFHVEAA